MKKIILFLAIITLVFAGKLYSQPKGWPDNPWSNFMVDSTIGYANGDALTTDGSSGAIVAWKDNRTGYYNVFVQKLDSLGNTKWGPNGLRISNLLGHASSINIIPDSVGGAVIGWAEGDTILLSRINSLGNPKYFIVVDPVSNLKGLKMVKGDSVSSILYWISSGVSGDTLFGQYIDSVGVKKWTPKDTIAKVPSIVESYGARASMTEFPLSTRVGCQY
jgi:hypothetical protein